MMPGFYWWIDDEVAGCSRPGGQYPQGRAPSTTKGGGDDAQALDRDLTWLRAQGIAAVLSLTETPLPPDVAEAHELEVLHLPVPDLHAPTPDQLAQALSFIDRQRALGHPVVVHCLVGEGRTGTVLAAHRVRAGATPGEALRQLRAIRPGGVSAREQQDALDAFARRRDWIV